ncbi:MAG: Uncharacterised protein [Methanobacteriota archaeon]|nr:MAG: Uncharacterised protein [Euryarchaeota archaeon]
MLVVVRIPVDDMRRTVPYLFVSILILQTLMYAVAPNAAAVSGRGGSSDDYFVTSIDVQNATATNTWIQPDGSAVTYIAEGDEVDIAVEVKRGGGALQGSNATVLVEMVHPIGFILNSTSWVTTDMLGGQSYTDTYTWTASIAHSHLNVTTNELSGGVIIRATVTNQYDDRNENDVFESQLPIAISQDAMEAGGDPRDTSVVTPVGMKTFYGGEYPPEGGSATGYGIWQKDTSGTSANGDAHWRHSNSGADYPSGSHSRLIYGFKSSSTQCGYGAFLDGKLSEAYFQYMCHQQLISAAYVSVQMNVQTWGVLGAGDYVALELWRGNGAPSSTISHNFSEHTPGTGQDQWTNITWDPTEILGGHTWSYGILFHSDTSGAASGMHVDDFVMFGISKESEYTLDIDCDNPTSGYTTPPNTIVPLHCEVTNNGYMPASVRLQSNISNESWMNPSLPMIRIDVPNSNNHGVNVLVPAIPAGNTTDMWINLSVPAGADVQQQVWQVWWEDAGGTQLGELGRITSDIAITEQYGVNLASNAPLVADTLGPSESGDIPFRLQNSGNREAGLTVTSSFQGDGWVSFVTDLNGTIVQMPIPLEKGEMVDLLLNVTAPADASPGEVPFTLRAVCPTCGQALFGVDVISKKIDVPTIREIDMIADTLEIVAPANGQAQIVYIDVLNLGNDDEQYSLSLTQSNWKLEAYLSVNETPMLDAWDGETSIALNLPMPVGLVPGLYTARITANSLDDTLVSKQLTINIEVTDTSAVNVSDQFTDQSFVPGDSAEQSMRFEVRNDGNQADRFVMSLDIPEGMNARFTQLMDNTTPLLEPQTSHNVTVTFTFDNDTAGQIYLKVIATSVNDETVSNSGRCKYTVGSQNLLRIISNEPILITEEGKYEVTVRVRNQHIAGQSVSVSVDQGETNKWFSADPASLDREFWLNVEDEREVTIIFEIEASSLYNLEEDFLETSVTVWARSNTVSDAASLELVVNLQKTSVTEALDEEAESSASDFDWVGISTWVVGGLLIAVLFGILLVVLNGGEEEEEQVWGGDGYEDSISATYGAVAAAPTIGAAGMVEPQKIVPEISPPSGPAPQPVVSSGPPLPAGGLPEGWTMEQWGHYGQQWLDNQK